MRPQLQQLPQQDWQLLSAYLDGQLTASDQAKLEKRLREQGELRMALDELKTTRAMLRSAGKQRVPRNFTLTPAMVEKAKPHPLLRLVPVLNFASAAAALAVVVLLVVGLLPGTNLAMQSAPAPTLNAVEDTTGSPAPFVWNSAPQGLGGGAADSAAPAPESLTAKGMGGGSGGGGGEGAGPGFVLPPQVVEDMPPASAAAPQAQSTAPVEAPAAQPEAPTEPAGVMMIPAMTATPAPAGTTAPMEPAAPNQIAPQQPETARQAEPQKPLTGSGPILGVVPPAEAQAENQQVIDTYGAQERQTLGPSAAWWIAPLVLGVLAAVLALAALLIRRKSAL